MRGLGPKGPRWMWMDVQAEGRLGLGAGGGDLTYMAEVLGPGPAGIFRLLMDLSHSLRCLGRLLRPGHNTFLLRAAQVKLPCTLEGMQTAALLRESNIRVCITGAIWGEGRGPFYTSFYVVQLAPPGAGNPCQKAYSLAPQQSTALAGGPVALMLLAGLGLGGPGRAGQEAVAA